jgi:hypothetical protein
MDKALASINRLLRRARDKEPPFPPTLLFEEGWMLRVVLQWFAETNAQEHELYFAPGARWFSEARLASAFLPRYRGDAYAEGYTNADGVIGHFHIGRIGQAELTLAPDAEQFIVTEAKMFSGLSRGTTRAPTFNQAARNVACMAEIARLANRDPSLIDVLAFYVLAPRQQIDVGKFAGLMEKVSLELVAGERVASYDAPKADWFENWFLPTLRAMRVNCLAWEDVIGFIKEADAPFGEDLERFYDRCLEFNRPERQTEGKGPDDAGPIEAS